MSRRHDAVFDDVLKGLDAGQPAGQGGDDRGGARFLKRSTALADHAGGARQEKVLRLVDPATCVMWAQHNRAYDLLTEANCRDLIDGIRAQGQQEFPAIVRRLSQPRGEVLYEVICGARRHFAVSWLRDHNYPQIRYLIEERELTDEEAFRLSDIENRDREDISDWERARDYLVAVECYYGGKQSVMAERLRVSPAWLSRYLALARLDAEVVAAFTSVREVKELHARQLKPLMSGEQGRAAVLAEAERLKQEQREGPVPAAQVMARLKAAAKPPKTRVAADAVYRRQPTESGVRMRRKGNRVTLEFERTLPDAALREALELYLKDRAGRA